MVPNPMMIFLGGFPIFFPHIFGLETPVTEDPTNSKISKIATPDGHGGASWSFWLHVDLWLGHALLMAPWIDE